MLAVQDTGLPGLKVVAPPRHGDERGFFSEVYKRSALAAAGLAADWVQDNHSYSRGRHVVRGLHFQAPPAAQAKLVRVTRGAILDVAVDLRRGSPTFGRAHAVELSADNWQQLFVPVGFAHGFCTLTEESEVLYKVSAEYAPASEGGLLWNDPALGIAWPVDEASATLSARDRRWPPLRELASPFVYDDG